MPEAFTAISKGRIFRLIDEYMQKPEKRFLDDLLAPEYAKLSSLGTEKGIIGSAQLDHTDREWFGDQGDRASWWPKNPQKQEIVRQAFVKGTELALGSSPAKPVVTYWVYGGDNFEAMVAESAQQVTVFLLTPPPPSMPTTQTRPHIDEKLWVIAPDARIAAIQEHFDPAERPKATPTRAAGISCMQMRAPE